MRPPAERSAQTAAARCKEGSAERQAQTFSVPSLETAVRQRMVVYLTVVFCGVNGRTPIRTASRRRRRGTGARFTERFGRCCYI